MVRYNWKKILKVTEGSIVDILLIVHTLTYNLTPKNYRDPLYKYWNKDWSGNSFLITPEAIFEKRPQFSDREWAEYIAVASYRNLNSYYENRKTTGYSKLKMELYTLDLRSPPKKGENKWLYNLPS